ncbi:hypothetical protein [Microcoleus sp. T2B6]|uniref:hypothetical protein n=1 Tax=Microcoleus sp. T2B6 TaxID=3055424 RepID=UPI002FD10B01
MLAITLFVVVSPVNAEGLKKVVSSKVAYGCVHKDYYQSLGETLVNGDTQAFVKGLLTAYKSGECLSLQQGTVVFVTDTAIWAGLSRVRPEGSMEEYWTAHENAVSQ